MKDIEGQIEIDLYTQHKTPTSVAISSTRPLLAAKVLVGKTPEQALSIIPLLFSVCGTAQSRAALSCIAQNIKLDTDPSLEIARDMLVLVENAKEHLMRIFLDWPDLFNLKPDNKHLPYLCQLLKEFKPVLFQNSDAFSLGSKLEVDNERLGDLIDAVEQYLQDHVFRNRTQSWLAHQDMHELCVWAKESRTIVAQTIKIICDQGWTSQGHESCEALPELDSHHLIKQLDAENADDFIAKPVWNGRCFETTSLSRQFKHPLIQSLHKEFGATLITRWLGRLVELANIPQQLHAMHEQLIDSQHDIRQQQTSTPAMPQAGLSQIEAARGRLIHRVELDKGMISNYQILAPTEWNFHPQGLIMKNLSAIRSEDKNEFDQLAHIMINAIDPCVGYKLRVH